MKSVRIFKLITGEMVIARLVSVDGQSISDMTETAINAIKLRESREFVVQSPALIVVNGQNKIFPIPMQPWVPPTELPSAAFAGSSIIMEPDMGELCHEPFKNMYFRSTSKIELATGGAVPIR